NSSFLTLKKKDGAFVDASFYTVDYKKALITFNKPIDADSLIVNYLKYPEDLTRTYRQINDSIIVGNTSNLGKLYKLSQESENQIKHSIINENTRNLDKLNKHAQASEKQNFTPFDGLSTSGSISRGVVIGNNQNSVLNSELDLQITGKLSEKVSLRASIQDANV